MLNNQYDNIFPLKVCYRIGGICVVTLKRIATERKHFNKLNIIYSFIEREAMNI